MKFWRWLAAVLVGLVIGCAFPVVVLAQEPHENPETAEQVYDPISLLRYYSETEDFLLRRQPELVGRRLDKLPFANVPEELERPLAELNVHEKGLAVLLAELEQDLERTRKLAEEFRLDEALELSNKMSGKLDQAYAELDNIEEGVELIGEKTGVASAPPRSELRRAYEELRDRMDQKRKVLDLDKGLSTEFLLGLQAIETSGKPQPTEITLEVEPASAFVGERVHFRGRLMAGGRPLAGRRIDLLLDGTEYAGAVTDEDGCYRGAFEVPYKYVPELILEALYRPRGEDVGFYLAAKSPAVRLKVLFYSASLSLKLPDKAYPGLETEIAGEFDYGGHPVLKARLVEVYLDDRLVSQLEAGPDFSLPLKLPREIELGQHRITISAPAKERHAPVVASAYLEVVQAMPVVELDLPRWALVPGSIRIAGRVFSEVGPVKGGEIKLKLGRAEAEAISAEDGSFAMTLQRGLGLELIGTQALRVWVLPQEPWNSAATLSTSLFLVNWVNSGGVLFLLLGLVILVRRRLRRLGLPRRVEKPSTISRVVEEVRPAVRLAEDLPAGEPPRRILGWYWRVVRLIQQVIRVTFRPQQTLREFLREVSPYLGSAAGLFAELTGLVEKLLYSRHQPTEEDARHSEAVSKQIEERLKRR